MGVRMIASDLDGTLVRTDGTVSDRSRRAIAAAEESGIPFVFVTGRPPRWMEQVADIVGHHGVAVCANGALIYDMHTASVVQENPLDGATALRLVRELRDAMPEVVFACERGLLFSHEPAFVPRFEMPDSSIAEMEELLAAPIIKLLVRHTELTPEQILTAATEAIGELAELATFTYGSDIAGGLVEVSAKGVTKAFGIERLASEHGVDARDVVAFGDMPNDLPMLAWAGRGVAVANAHPDVLAMADEVTASNDDDGVAQIVERLLARSVPA
jgi:Cof subfamily protein (haloacid dehalogenase superfamily)